MSLNLVNRSRLYCQSSVRRQAGSALVIGIFVITVMFLLAAALINIAEDADSGQPKRCGGPAD